MFAGANDVAIPPEYQRRLADLFKKSQLFLADDDHMMKNLQAAGLYNRLHLNFLIHGHKSEELTDVLAEAKDHLAEQ